MDNKYKEGQTVHSVKNPKEELVIRRYAKRIYYCKIKNDPDAKEKVFFERELESKN